MKILFHPILPLRLCASAVILLAATLCAADVRLICNANPAAEQVSHYAFWERMDGTNWTLIGTTSDATNGVRFQRPFGRYTWSATAFNSAGMSDYATPLEWELRDDGVTLKRPGAPVKLVAIINPWLLFPPSTGTPSTLTNGLLFAYRMDESSGNLSPSAGSITMTNVGSMGYNTSGGIINGAVSNSTFASGSRYFWSANKWYAGTITSMSIGFWCFSTNTVAGSTDGDMWGPSQYNSGGTGTNVQFYTALRTALAGSARRAEVAITDRNTTTARKIYRTTNSLPANQWNLIVMTFTNNVLKLYTNGVEVTGAELNKDQDNTVTTIGTVPDNASAIGTIQVTASGGAGAHNGNGALDMAFGYNRVLTDAEVAELWNSGAGRDPSNP